MAKKKISPKVLSLLKSKSGIMLDVGCSDHKQPGFVGMDIRPVKGVDIVHDVEELPWPLPDECCNLVLMSHLWEHIEPKYRVRVMDELWRILKPGRQLLISSPYATSVGAFQDPTHYTCPNENTFTYFDPTKPLYQIYKPKPWRLVRNDWVAIGNMEVILEKLTDEMARNYIEELEKRK
jgi:predicted SAM-dependent methyltransferase